MVTVQSVTYYVNHWCRLDDLCIRSGSVQEMCRKKITSLHEHRKTTLVYFQVTQIKTFNDYYAKLLKVQALSVLVFNWAFYHKFVMFLDFAKLTKWLSVNLTCSKMQDNNFDTYMNTFIEDIYWFEVSWNLLGFNLIDWVNLFSRNELNFCQFVMTKIMTHALRPIMFHVIRLVIQSNFIKTTCSWFL